MRIQIDTENKTIKLESEVSLDEFFKMIKKLLPNDSWKEFKLLTDSIIYWTNPYPIIIKKYKPYTPPNYPWYSPHHVFPYTTGDPLPEKPELISGIYNIEIN